MNDMVLHVALASEIESSPWRNPLSKSGIVVYLAKSLAETMYYHQSYPMLAILLEVDGKENEMTELIGQLKLMAGEKGCPPILCVTAGEASLAALNEWVGRGASDLVSSAAPETVLLWRLETLRDQALLRRQSDPENSPAELARLTRKHLHDLSQPLSAVQGKLQLMSIKVGDSDPNHETYKELVGLIQRVSAEIMEVHQLQRKMS